MSFSSGKIDAGTLAVCQKNAGSKLPVFCLEETGSTNADAAKMLATGTPAGDFAVVAARQTAGRGRAGRLWESDAIGNIYLSCGFRPNILPEKLANFTLWLGLSVAEMLREKYGVPAFVKWPNDIFCEGKKLAGMLTEAHIDAARVRGIVFGIGLNVNFEPATLPSAVREIATSLRVFFRGNAPLDVNRVCADLLVAIERAYADFLAGTHTKKLLSRWEKFDFLAEKKVTAIYGNEEISGIAQGIDAKGRIRIATENGGTVAFSAGDVSLKKDAAGKAC